MHRKNSRNQESSNSASRFNLTAGTKQTAQPDPISRQIGLTNLNKASSLLKNEIHQLIDDLDRPNESLSLSSFSQSPNLLKTRTHHQTEDSNHNYPAHLINTALGDTLGRSEMEQTSEEIINKSCQIKSLSITGGTNNHRHINASSPSCLDDGDSQELDDDEGDENELIDDTVERSASFIDKSRNRSTNHINASEEDEELEQAEDDDNVEDLPYEDGHYINRDETMNRSSYSGGRDSPDFNRQAAGNDDLTISNTVISNATYRATSNGFVNDTRRDKQSRTFADSVIKHLPLNKQQNTSACNSNRTNSGYQGKFKARIAHNRQDLRQEDHATTDENNQDDTYEDHSMEERDKDDSSRLDSSDISGLDSFAQTQRSRISRFVNTKSHSNNRRGNKYHGQSQNEEQFTDDQIQLSKRSPYMDGRGKQKGKLYENLDQDESLNLTASSQERRSQWGGGDVSQRSMIGASKVTANNRTSNSDQSASVVNNPLGGNKNGSNQFNRLTNNLHNILQTPNYNATTVVTGGSRHNRSLQRDSELEQALEQESEPQIKQNQRESSRTKQQNSTSNQVATLESNEFKKLKIEISQIYVQKEQFKKQSEYMEKVCQQKENEVNELQLAFEDEKLKLLDVKQHLQFLREKQKSEISFKDLRGKFLDQSRQENKYLTKELKKKEQQLTSLESQLQKHQMEDQNQIDIYTQQISNLVGELNKQRIIIDSLKRKIEEYSHNQTIQERNFQADVEMLKEEFENQIKNLAQQYNDQCQHLISVEQLLKDSKQSVKNKEKEVMKVQKDTQKMNQIIEAQEKEKQRVTEELQNFKERCKDLEQELEQTRYAENNSIFGNQTNKSGLNKSVMNGHSADYELKKMKDLLSQQVSKEKENAQKWKGKCEDMELKSNRMKEELTLKLQEQAVMEKFNQDQELIKELDRSKQQVQQLQVLDLKIRECFSLSRSDDLDTKLVEINNQLEQGKYYQQEFQKCSSQLIDLQQQQKQLYLQKQNESVSNQNSSGISQEKEMSQFRVTMILDKNKQIEQLQKQIKSEQQEKEQIENMLFTSNQTANQLKSDLESYQQQIEMINSDLERVTESKSKAEQNVEELKNTLRQKIRELELVQQTQKDQVSKKQNTSMVDQVEKKKYMELVHLIMDLDLATDPLSQVNLALQQSFIDEHEQAVKHLQEQRRLVFELISSLKKQNQSEREQFEDQLDSNSEKVELFEELKRENMELLQQISEMERGIEVMKIELEGQREANLKVGKQLKDSENLNLRLKNENDEQKNDLRKLMRTQEHLYKDKKSVQQVQVTPVNIKSSIEYERIVMHYEDSLSKCRQEIEKLSAKQGCLSEIKQSVINEEQVEIKFKGQVLEFLDKVIDSKQVMPEMNDFSFQLIQRIEKIRCQEPQIMHRNLKRSSINNIERSKSTENKENMKNVLNEPLNLKSSKGSQNLLEESFNKENESSNNNGDELVWSIARLLKQSQGTGQNTFGRQQLQLNNQQQFKNFFANEDNTSLLLLSELITQQQNPSQVRSSEINQEIEKLQQELSCKDQELRRCQDIISQFEKEQQELKEKWELEMTEIQEQLMKKEYFISEYQEKLALMKKQNDAFEKEIRSKEDRLSKNEADLTFAQSTNKKEIEDQYYQSQLKMKSEIESLKEQMKKELFEKAELLDQEYRAMDELKQKMREEFEQKAKSLEQKYSMKIESQENEFRQKLFLMEKDVRNGCEKNQDETVSKIQKELQDQQERKVRELKEESQLALKQQKEEWMKEREEGKKGREKESKKFKDETDKLKRSYEDKIKKLETERDVEREQIEQDFKQKIENLNQKGKKESKQAVEKVRAELRNQMDTVKNESAKAKAEWERDRKKLLSEYQAEIDKLKQENEDSSNTAIKLEKEKQQGIWKRKLEEKERECTRKIESIEEDTHKMCENIKTEMMNEKERGILIAKEEARIQLRMEVVDQLEKEFKEKVEKLKFVQGEEIQKLKEKYELALRQEKASSLPSTHSVTPRVEQKPSTKSVDVQCSILVEPVKEEQKESDSILNESEQQNWQIKKSSNSQNNQLVNQSIYTQVTNSQAFIEQLKFNFEEELERQQQIFEVQLLTKQNQSVKIFEDVLTLELDKILQSIYHKSQMSNCSNTNQKNKSQMELEITRKEINSVITDILNRNDDRKEKQMKNSLEVVKRKISEILRQFKVELENKMNKNNTLPALIKEKRKLTDTAHGQANNFSEYLGSQDPEFCSEFSQSDSQDLQSENFPSKPPTPRQTNFLSKTQNPDIKQRQSRENSQQKQKQRSDIKNYTEFVQGDESEYTSGMVMNANQSTDNCFKDNILKKIAPIPNQKGVMVVEVTKIVRDLKMLSQTIKQAKFYRLLMNVSEWSGDQKEANEDEQRGSNEGECSVQSYRQLLNDFFRLIIKLNNGVDQVGKAEEIYKLKLTNSELKSQINSFEAERKKVQKQVQIDEILNFFGGQQQTCQETNQVLQKLESTQFQINKLQFQLFQLIDNFTIQVVKDQNHPIDVLDKSIFSVNQKCKEYFSSNPNLFLNQPENNLLQSEYSPEGQGYAQKICPEMLSPDETAQLIAQVFSKLNQPNTNEFTIGSKGFNSGPTGLGQTNNNQLDTYQSFFQTFMSNEEYVKSAEHFIKKYREHQHLNQTVKNPMKKLNLPLQVMKSNDHNKTLQMAINQSKSQMNYSQSQFGSIHSCPQIGGGFTPKSNFYQY